MGDDALTQDYAVAFGGKAGLGRSPALVLIDFVEAYFAPASPLYAGVEQALASALRVRAAARAAGVPVILTNVVYHPGGVDGGRFFEKVPALRAFEAGSPMGAWPQGLVPEADEIVLTKQYPSAFFGTSLASTLTARGIDQVILTGLSTSGCVRASCVDAVSHGFRTAVVAEACGDRHPGPHEANLFDMNAKYADVVSEDAIVAYLASLEQAR
ncbi:MAG TPA: isochorismatase family protein [Novosphingobium sp.]|nr:isochorismatase family protein [Novosphingobium sp.]